MAVGTNAEVGEKHRGVGSRFFDSLFEKNATL